MLTNDLDNFRLITMLRLNMVKGENHEHQSNGSVFLAGKRKRKS